MSNNQQKIALKKYHLALDANLRHDSVKAIAAACHVTQAIVYGWMRGNKIREIYKKTISEVTGIKIEKL